MAKNKVDLILENNCNFLDVYAKVDLVVCHVLKRCIRKVKCNCTTDIKFITLYYTKKMSYYCTVNDKIPIEQRSSVIYQISCPGCLKRYVGKTDRCFHIRMNEHGRKPDQSMHRHLRNCSYFQELGQLYSLPCDDETVNIDIKENTTNAVLNNCRIIDQNNNWSQLSFLEAYYIKTLKPEINLKN